MSDIFALSDEATDTVASQEPIWATFAGVSGHDGRWPDMSPEGVADTRTMWSRIKAQAEECPTPDDRTALAKAVLLDECQLAMESIDSGRPFFELNNITSPHQDLRFVYGSMDMSTLQGWEDICSRLASTGSALDGYRRLLEEGRLSGRTVARRQVEAVLEQGGSLKSESSVLDQLAEKFAASNLGDDALADRLSEAIAAAKAAYVEIDRYLAETYLADATESDGVGRSRYVAEAEAHLGCSLDPDETYRWGWDEVERLWADLKTACAEIDGDAPVAEVIDRLKTGAEFAAVDEAHFVQLMTERQHQALENLQGVHFDVPEQIRSIAVQVEPAGGASAAHYVPPSEDFSRVGSVWYPVEGNNHFPLFDEVTTAYHEGFPGHHLQVGVQMTQGDELSRFHKTMVWHPGSGEGWALYAERFMEEIGYLERPEYRVGLLSSQLLRSCRIAIDIGVHCGLAIPADVTFHPGSEWSFELAEELLTERALMSADAARSEVIRYFGWPGQAITYKVGEQAILDMRAEHSGRPNFDLKSFHSHLLAVGSVGLDLLRRQMAGVTY